MMASILLRLTTVTTHLSSHSDLKLPLPFYIPFFPFCTVRDARSEIIYQRTWPYIMKQITKTIANKKWTGPSTLALKCRR